MSSALPLPFSSLLRSSSPRDALSSSLNDSLCLRLPSVDPNDVCLVTGEDADEPATEVFAELAFRRLPSVESIDDRGNELSSVATVEYVAVDILRMCAWVYGVVVMVDSGC